LNEKWQGDAAIGAAVFLGEQVRSAIVDALNLDESLSELERGLNRIAQATAIFRAHD
jgi:hypothetical protein